MSGTCLIWPNHSSCKSLSISSITHLFSITISHFQNETCKSEKQIMFCQLFKLTECSTSIIVAETFSYGEVRNNVEICDVYDDLYTNISLLQDSSNSENIVHDIFYDIYLNMTEVSIFQKL